MQNLKYHILNSISILLFSYFTAITINQFFKFGFAPSYSASHKKSRIHEKSIKHRNFDDYKIIIESGFFKIASESNQETSPKSTAPEQLTDLYLLGTITGPASIARALIKKRTEKVPGIFRLWRDVYGYKLVRIDNNKVYLKIDSNVKILDMFAKRKTSKRSRQSKRSSSTGTSKIKKSISRSEIQQKVLGNMDNALRGLRAGPNRVNGKVDGYKIYRIKPYNMLYKFGARNGDVIKRVNGHPIDSTQKLYKMWQSLKDDSKISVDLNRGGKSIRFDFNVTD